MDADGAKRRARRRRTAKACGPDAPVLASSFAEYPPGDGGKKAGHRGERVISRKPSRREGRTASAEPVCSCAFLVATFARETAGAARTRSSLRPLYFRGRNDRPNLGQFGPRDREAVSCRRGRHCERSEAIHRAARKKAGLLRFARNDGIWCFAVTRNPREERNTGRFGRSIKRIPDCASLRPDYDG